MPRPLADSINAACSEPTRFVFGCDPSDLNARRVLGSKVRAMLRGAHRFYIDDEVTAAACTLGVQHPDILMQMLPRARTPFASVWLEWSVAAQINAVGGTLYDDAPERSGVVVEQLDDNEPIFRLTSFAGPAPGERVKCYVSSLATLYHLRTPIFNARKLSDYEEVVRMSDLPEQLVRQSFVGAGYFALREDDADEAELHQRMQHCDALTRHAAYIFNPLTSSFHRDVIAGRYDDKVIDAGWGDQREWQPAPKAVQSQVRNAILEGAGTWRLVMSLLALMNAQDFVERDRPFKFGKSYTVGRHVLPYLDHITVKLKLPRHIVVQRMARELAESLPRRRHGVPGHFAQSRKKGDPNCEHAYIDVSPTHERCVLCNHSRWWVKSHERGDASVGYVLKDRLVTRR